MGAEGVKAGDEVVGNHTKNGKEGKRVGGKGRESGWNGEQW